MESIEDVVYRVLQRAIDQRKRARLLREHREFSAAQEPQGEEITMTTHAPGRGQWKTVHHGKGAVSKNTPGGGYMETARANGRGDVARKLK